MVVVVRPIVPRTFASLLLVLLLAVNLPIVPGQAEPAAGCADPHDAELVGRVCTTASGLLKIMGDEEQYTHGLDPAGDMALASIVAPPVPPVCTTSPTSYHARAIYTHPSDRASQYSTRAGEFRTIIERTNGLLRDEAAKFGYRHDYRVLCSASGTIVVDAVKLSTTHSTTTFSSIVNDLRAAGYDDNNVKYMVWHEYGSCIGGVGHVYNDDRLILDNYNNANPNSVPMFGVNFGCSGDNGVRVTMHENGHNMGAVQDSAPRSTQAGHCRDGLDIMCYADGGLSYDPHVCTDKQHYDCNHDDYYHPDPPSGSYLASYWNVGSSLNRFLVRQPLGPTAAAGTDQSARDADGDGIETFLLDGSASFGADPIVSYEWRSGGTLLATGAKPSVPLPVGTNAVTLTVTDSAGLSDDDQVILTVLPNRPPVAAAGPDQVARDSDADGQESLTLIGTSSSDPDGPIARYDWTWGGASIGTGPTPTVMLPVGTHDILLTVTDTGGLSATDTVKAIVHPNQAPLAAAPADVTRQDLDSDGFETIVLDGRASTDPDGALVTYEWFEGGASLATGSLASVPLAVGVHTITLRVTDNGGLTDEDTMVATILANRPPVAAFTVTCTDTVCSFDGRGSSDPDNDALTHTWRFGDGSTGSGRTVDHAYDHAGRFTACLTVDDGRGHTDTVCDLVRVVAETYRQPFAYGTKPPEWTLSGMWHVSNRCASATSGLYYLGYHRTQLPIVANAATCHYQDIARTQGSASFPLDISDATIAALSFETRWVTEQGDDPFDLRFIEVAPRGTNEWTLLDAWDARDANRPDWHTRTYDLTSHVGQELVVRFRFDSVDEVNNLSEGWFIDDVRVHSDQAP